MFIIALILMKFDYGPMRLHEMNARFKNDLYTTGDRADGDNDAIDCNQNGRVIDLILPVAVLIVTSSKTARSLRLEFITKFLP